MCKQFNAETPILVLVGNNSSFQNRDSWPLMKERIFSTVGYQLTWLSYFSWQTEPFSGQPHGLEVTACDNSLRPQLSAQT